MLVAIYAFSLDANGLILQCNFKFFNAVIIGNHYSCQNAVFSSDGNSTHVVAVTGTHLSGKSNADVEGFSWINDEMQLSRIPKGIEKFFPKIASFNCHNGSLTSVTSEDIRVFPQLQLLSIHYNKLTSLDGDFFKYNPMISWIYFKSNQLRNIGYGLLDGLSNLTSANFGLNPCITFQATTPTEIQELKIKLRDQCPALMTTTVSSPTSSSDCADELKQLREENRYLKGLVEYCTNPQ